MQKNYSIYFVKFAYRISPGDPPAPVSGMLYNEDHKRWEPINDLNSSGIQWDENPLLIGYDMTRDLICLKQLGITIPAQVLDLRAEYRCQVSGTDAMEHDAFHQAVSQSGNQFVPALFSSYDLEELSITGDLDTDRIDNALKHQIRSQMALLEHLGPGIDIDAACSRGRFICAAAEIEAHGIPIDVEQYERIRDNRERIIQTVVSEYDKYGIYEGTSFRTEKFIDFLKRSGIDWPRNRKKGIQLTQKTFEEMGEKHPEIKAIAHLRKMVSQLNRFELPIGSDERNRFGVRPFTAKTSRNQPRSSECIFGLSSWLRNLIQPKPGTVLAYIDWCQQEFGIAAALSQDANMMKAYDSGDPYLEFGKQAGLIPENGTKQTHPQEREICKQCILGLQYGMGVHSLKTRMGCGEEQTRALLKHHKRVYGRFWSWLEAYVSNAKKCGYAESLVGWRMRVDQNTKERCVQNFPMQSNGAELMRDACCRAVDQRIRILCPVHDAVLIECDEHHTEKPIQIMTESMNQASISLLGGYQLRSDIQIITDHYNPVKGEDLWQLYRRVLSQKIQNRCPRNGSI